MSVRTGLVGIISGGAVNFGNKKKFVNNLVDKKFLFITVQTLNIKYSNNVGVLVKSALKIIKVSGKIQSNISRLQTLTTNICRNKRKL